jgi:multiple sugar transport system substrate-binding protein
MRELSKRIIVLLSIFLLCIPIFAGGEQETGSTSDGPVKLVIWGGVPIESGPQDVIDSFNAKFADQDIQAEYVRFVNDDQGNLKLETSLLAGSDIDLYISYGYNRYVKRAEGNMALALDDLMTRDGFNPVEVIGADGAQKSLVEGRYYGIDTKTYNNGFFANKDMFDAAGIPIPTSWTWDEFREVANKLSHGGGADRVYGVYMNSSWDKAFPLNMVSSQLGGDHIYNDTLTGTTLDNPIYKKTLTTAVQMMQEGSMPSHQEAVTQKLSSTSLFLNEKAAMVSGTWIIRDIKNIEKYPHNFVTAYIPFPTDNPDGTFYTEGGPGDTMSINPKSKAIEEAWKFLQWYVKGGILPMAPYGRFPLYTKTNMNELADLVLDGVEEYFHTDSIVKGCLTPAENYAIHIKSHPEVVSILKEECEAAYLGAKSVEQALNDAKRRADAVLTQK